MLTIVVIEEDIAMRTLFCEWLDAAGYRVRGRSVRADVPQAGVDLVVVDLLDLPGKGAESVRQVAAIYPCATLIGISTQLGRVLPPDSPQVRTLGVAALVSKPCTRSELLTAVAGAIGPAR